MYTIHLISFVCYAMYIMWQKWSEKLRWIHTNMTETEFSHANSKIKSTSLRVKVTKTFHAFKTDSQGKLI